MDNLLSYKRYATNLVIANITVTFVWLLLSISVTKNLIEENNLFLMSSLSVLSFVNVLTAYFGITGVMRRYTCELTTYYILSRIVILSECLLYLLILFAGKRDGPSAYHPVINNVQTGVTIVVIITQIWLFYEMRNFEKLAKSEEFDDFDVFRVRRLSSPPDILNITKNSRVYSLTDQLLSNPFNGNYPKENRDSLHNSLRTSMSFGPQPVYQPLSTPLLEELPQSLSNQWYYPPNQPSIHNF